MLTLFRPIRFASLALLLSATAGLRAVDTIYMQVPGVKGESTSKSHSAWISLYALSSCLSNSSGKASACDISISKDIDLSTTGVYANLLTGKGTGASKVLVDVCGVNSVGAEICYYKLQMRNVRFTSASGGTSDGATRASESWTMAFDAISWTYTPTWWATPGTPVTQCWDFTTNTAVCP